MNKTERILNLTQHDATSAQLDAGVIEPEFKDEIREYITFDQIPTKLEMTHRANMIVGVISNDMFSSVMIGGAPFFMSILEHELRMNSIKVVYAFSKRESTDVERDGKVIKTSVFKHVGFVEV